MEKLQIVDGIQYRGKIPQKAKLFPVSIQKRMAKQRVFVEGKIGTLKSAYGCSKYQYKEDNSDVWITFGMIYSYISCTNVIMIVLYHFNHLY